MVTFCLTLINVNGFEIKFVSSYIASEGLDTLMDLFSKQKQKQKQNRKKKAKQNHILKD